MKILLTSLLFLASLPAMACDSDLLDQDFRRLASTDEVNLCESYEGKVLLIVNTAGARQRGKDRRILPAYLWRSVSDVRKDLG
jgi:hypothetical protein